jgi:hypothetical protein
MKQNLKKHKKNSSQKIVKLAKVSQKLSKNCQNLSKNNQKIVKKMSKTCQKSAKSSVSITATFYTPQKNVTFCHSFYYIKKR